MRRLVLGERTLATSQPPGTAHGVSADPVHLLCLGAHSDDIEIGASGALLGLLQGRPGGSVTWVVASASGDREVEARTSAEALVGSTAKLSVHVLGMRDGYLDASRAALKEALETIRSTLTYEPEVIFTHYRHDRHQDHRALCDVTWSLWRDHLILEYEVPKWDGDLSQPNVYVPVAEDLVNRKLAHLSTHFSSQRNKDWFDEETFRGLMRLRGLECRSPSRYAEAFHGRKLVLAASCSH